MTPLPPDPYKILGVSKDAQIPEIRSAHRKLVLKCHPDKVQDPKLKAQKQDEFQKVQQAYELLSDDNERQKYDDQVTLAELRRQFQNKANISTPRSSPKEYNVYTAESPRATANPGLSSTPPHSKSYTYSRSWEDDIGRGPRIFDAGPSRSSRREAAYAERPSKREAERERERERDTRDREKERERDRRRRAEDAARRADKEAKDVRRAEKKQREKQRDKDIRRDTDEKKRYAKPYIESFDDESPASKSERKKSTSKKYDEKRDRSSGREDSPAAMPAPPPPPPPPRPQRSYSTLDYAHSYIEASRAKNGGLQRSATYHARNVQPPAPTPPPVVGPFALPDEDVHRSSAKPRRGSGDGPRLSRERSYRASSREPLDDPIVVSASPGRLAAQFQNVAPTSPVTSSSPPRRDLPRTSTMPIDAAFARTVPGIPRAQTFNSFGEASPRGRDRSRMHAQIDEEEESDSDDEYDRRPRDRKHRSSRRHRSPEAARPENVSRYQVDGGRAKLQSSYSRRLEPEAEQVRYYSTAGSIPIPVTETRPSMPIRESGYSAPGMKFPKVKTSKAYSYDDVQYSNYYDKPYREEYSAYP
ncbi:Chaperone protein DnaJ [Tolypocladium capitatum]|uniref:Chaperone protein DnaJ n=1 Tax=Tolypocladium capitatum TaxID=45235 RepID=A0A2K3QM31_9HYPO|nr:Chaperone protein DnaJ [Tolypocladium capitatum]